MHNRGLLIFITCMAFLSCAKIPLPIEDQQGMLLEEWRYSEHRTPAEFLEAEIDDNLSTVFFIQDHIFRADSVELVEALIPLFFDMGIREIYVYFLDTSEQTRIDAFLTDGEGSAHEILRASNARMGYTEYTGFLDSIRVFNQLGDSADSMRVVGLADGNMMSTKLLNHAISQGVDAPPAFLWLLNDHRNQIPEPRGEGMVHTILSHYGPIETGYRNGGLVERKVTQWDMRDRSFIFRPTEPPFSQWAERPNISDIVIVTAFPYRAVTPLDDFISIENLESAMVFFPKIRQIIIPNIVAFRMNSIIRRDARKYSKKLAQFQKKLEQGGPSP